MRRALYAGVVLAFVPGVAFGAGGGPPPYDYARGAGDRFTGVIAAALAREGATKLVGLPSIEGGTGGAVGITRATGAGRPHAFAVVDVVETAAGDPDAALCIRIAGDGLPNSVEGGGPVCQFLDDGVRFEGGVFIETFAELQRPRAAVNAEVYLSWLRHPIENGGVVSVARVSEIGFHPA